jgi:hypothetical protein
MKKILHHCYNADCTKANSKAICSASSNRYATCQQIRSNLHPPVGYPSAHLRNAMQNILINITENQINQKHISWAYEERFDNNQQIIVLFEIVERIYPHPQAPNDATISQIEKIESKRYRLTDSKVAPIILLKHALDNVSLTRNL